MESETFYAFVRQTAWLRAARMAIAIWKIWKDELLLCKFCKQH